MPKPAAKQRYLKITTYYPEKIILSISTDGLCMTDYGGSGKFVESIALNRIKRLISGKIKRISQKA